MIGKMAKAPRLLWEILVVFFVLCVAASCSKKEEKTTEIRIGAILPLTGDAGSWGQAGREGIDLAIGEANKRAQSGKKKISVIYEDTQAQPEKGASAMLKLATIDKVPGVVGDLVSATTLAAAPIADQYHVVLLSPTASAPAISEAGPYVFRIWPSDLAEGKAIAEFAAGGLRLKRVAILYIQNDYGLALKNIFEKDFEKMGGQIQSAVPYKPDETNFRAYLLKINEHKPEAIYLISYYKDAGIALKQAAELGIHVQFLGTTAIEEPKLLDIAGDAAEGVIYPMSTGYDPSSDRQPVKDFKKDFERTYGKEPTFVQAQCYDAAGILILALEQGKTTGPEIQKFLAQLKDYEGVTGTTSFDNNGDVVKATVIKTIRGGAFVPYAQ